MIEDIGTLIMLVLLQAVLGFDNLLYISLESRRAPEDKRKSVRTIGIAIAIVLRIGLLFLLTALIKLLEDPFFDFELGDFLSGNLSGHAIIVLFGGGFIMWTAVKEIWHMMHFDPSTELDKEPANPRKIIAMIVLMNLIFSFDSILGAMALTKKFWIMTVAIVISGLLMIWLADRVSTFLQKNKMYEVLGLFVLLIVGIMLLSEGGELAHVHILGSPVHAMSKTTFYFVIAVLILIDIVQGRYQRNLLKKK